MKLHTVYRSSDAENTKLRPAGYAKLTCLHSFLRAHGACPDTADLLFLNSGAIPQDQVAAMRSAGEIVARGRLELHESYWAAIDLASQRGWADDDLVYFAEDDYLYREETFASLCGAAGRLPAGAYLAPYATVGDRMPNGEALHAGLRRASAPPARLTEAAGIAWHRALSHTSSFAVRVGVLRADRALHHVAPRCSGAWDHALSLAYQGSAPYGPRGLVEPLREGSGATPGRRARIVAWRAALGALALAARRRGRLLAAPRPALATHMEGALMATGTDWDAEADAARRWGDG